MRFQKVTSHKYIGQDGYSIICCKDNSFAICKDSKPTSWGNGFCSIKAAECFLNSHDYTNATTDELPLSADDLVFAIDMYGFESSRYDSNKVVCGNIYLRILDSDPISVIAGVRGGDQVTVTTPNELFEFLDSHIDAEDIFSSVVLRGLELRSILAAKLPPKNDKRNSKDATKNLVRVKSSNVWAYGVEIKDRKAQVGDVYVQFKGKNGGAGDVYVYFDVPVRVYRKLVSAPSKGHAVWALLRNNFLYSKLTGSKRGVLPNAVNH